MPHLVCPRCRRANPGEAVFCWFDGFVLNQSVGAGAPGSQLPQEFVFASGRRCRTYDDLVQGCQYEWEEARELLKRGDLGRFLARIGRMDLLRSAQEAQSQPDPDIALYTFIGNLPANQVQGPRLDIHPRRLILGQMRAGEQRQVQLTVTNQGKGLLQGKLTLSENDGWLKVVNGADDRHFPLKTARDQSVTLRVDARGLAAARKYSAKLTVITNGGIVEAPVSLDVTPVAFPKPPFQGAASPREMAERMRANPKPAAPLLENGEVARWFASNSWNYPVPGAPARGVAAVQQFFECMGLSKPPPLQLSDDQVRLQCDAPQVARGQVTLRTTTKKWVYAQVVSDQVWLRVTTPNVSGPQQAQISFEADSSLMDANRAHDGVVTVIANAGQKFLVRVRVEVGRPRGGRTPPPPSVAPRPVAAFQAARPAPVLAPPPPPTPPAPRNSAVLQPPPVRFSTVKPPPAVAVPAPDAVPATAAAPEPPRRTVPLATNLVRGFVVGAVLLLLLRVLLAFPADLGWLFTARGDPGRPPAGSLEAWRRGPVAEESGDKASVVDPVYLREFISTTWWVGCIVGGLLAYRFGGRWSDYVCAVTAGAGAGAAGGATLACLLVLIDGPVRGVLGILKGGSLDAASPWLATALWLFLAVAWWTALGAGIGLLLGAFGARGARLLAAAASPLAWLFRLVGLRSIADFFALQ